MSSRPMLNVSSSSTIYYCFIIVIMFAKKTAQDRLDRIPDMSLKPPDIPAALGSKLYPREDLSLDSTISVPAAMRVRSLTRKKDELRGLQDMKADYYLDMRDKYAHRARYCSTCSESVSSVRLELDKPVIHTHVSSLLKRVSCSTDYWGDFRCSSCSSNFHSFHYGSRYPILATSSTLTGWQGVRTENGYKGDSIHVELVGVPGAHVQHVHHAVVAEYGAMHRPLDVLVVAGLNNLAAGHTPILVMDELEEFKRDILKISGSSFAVATLPFPPALAQLPEDKFRVQGNITEDLKTLNFSIRDLNMEGSQSMMVEKAPTFHTWGLRSLPAKKKVGPRNLMELLPQHRQKDWREERPENQIHLNDRLRLRMGRAVVKYFCSIYEV